MLISIKGFDKVMKRFKGAEKVDMTQPVKVGTRIVQRSAKQKAPVDTGDLEGSIRRSFSGANTSMPTGRVSTNIEYAVYVEYGTSKMLAQPFLRPALKDSSKELNKLFSEHIKKSLK